MAYGTRVSQRDGRVSSCVCYPKQSEVQGTVGSKHHGFVIPLILSGRVRKCVDVWVQAARARGGAGFSRGGAGFLSLRTHSERSVRVNVHWNGLAVAS